MLRVDQTVDSAGAIADGTSLQAQTNVATELSQFSSHDAVNQEGDSHREQKGADGGDRRADGRRVFASPGHVHEEAAGLSEDADDEDGAGSMLLCLRQAGPREEIDEEQEHEKENARMRMPGPEPGPPKRRESIPLGK